MPWTRKQVKKLLSSDSPLSSDQQAKMKAELHANPAMGHAKKGSAALKKGSPAPTGKAEPIRRGGEPLHAPKRKYPDVNMYDWRNR